MPPNRKPYMLSADKQTDFPPLGNAIYLMYQRPNLKCLLHVYTWPSVGAEWSIHYSKQPSAFIDLGGEDTTQGGLHPLLLAVWPLVHTRPGF
jgi:hypothetical protein